MIGFISSLFARGEPAVSEAEPRDAAAIAALHGASFRRGWSEQEVEGLLLDRHVIAHRALAGAQLAGFIMSRLVEDEAEILSVAVAAASAGRGLARRLLDLHLRRLAGLARAPCFWKSTNTTRRRFGFTSAPVFAKFRAAPNYYPEAAGKAAAALVLRRDLADAWTHPRHAQYDINGCKTPTEKSQRRRRDQRKQIHS